MITEYAKKELELAGFFDKDSDYGGMIGNAVMELITLFAGQRHSGNSASMVRGLFNLLADYKPISLLTVEDDEWNKSGDHYQNNRNSAVFKDGENGRPYYIYAYNKTSKDLNSCWTGSLELSNGKWLTKCYIKDLSNMPTVTINLEIVRHSDDGGGWDFVPAPMSALDELEKYYDLEFV